MTKEAFATLREHLARIETLESVMGILGWDEATMMPPRGAELRGAHRALLSEVGHGWQTDPRIAEWLEALAPSKDPIERACVRNLGRTFERERRVDPKLVGELARAKSEGFATWLEAKPKADFARFEKPLTRLLELSIRRAEQIDPNRHPYEVTLEEYDPGTTVGDLRDMFARLRDGLTPLLHAIAERPTPPEYDRAFDKDGQYALHREVATAMGYDFRSGRLDHAEHPFTSGHGEGDVRITTHIYETDLIGGLTSTIHEVGHGLYEQGLPRELAGTPLAGTTVAHAASYGLHESQSRFWENFVGRSRPFAGWLAGRVAERFGGDVDADVLHRALNRVERGLIRVQADEVTYNLHIIVRFEIELALFEGKLKVSELPEAWNARYAEMLGLRPENDAVGVLQDVHWSGGAFGYFPSYTLGNLYAASLANAMLEAHPNVMDEVAEGRFETILSFLRDRVHRHGHLLEAPEIIRAAVGERDHVEDLLSYLWDRVGTLYGVTRGT
ncbi:MAG: carboxypeptidase M32 [Sandaracinaceae bacterium]